MIDQIKIGHFLRELRKEKSLTQEALADYYDVDINEIIDGERKSEVTKEKETLRKVADYAETEKQLVVKRRCIATFVVTALLALGIATGCVLFPKLPESSFLNSGSLGMGIGVIGLIILWGIIIREKRKNSSQNW